MGAKTAAMPFWPQRRALRPLTKLWERMSALGIDLAMEPA